MYEQQIEITHSGYTDTVYPSCDDSGCIMVLLICVDVPLRVAHDYDNRIEDLPLGKGAVLNIGPLDTTDDCQHCAACGEFLRHGNRYPHDPENGCQHDPDDLKDPPALDRPHIDFDGHPAMLAFWGRTPAETVTTEQER